MKKLDLPSFEINNLNSKSHVYINSEGVISREYVDALNRNRVICSFGEAEKVKRIIKELKIGVHSYAGDDWPQLTKTDQMTSDRVLRSKDSISDNDLDHETVADTYNRTTSAEESDYEMIRLNKKPPVIVRPPLEGPQTEPTDPPGPIQEGDVAEFFPIYTDILPIRVVNVTQRRMDCCLEPKQEPLYLSLMTKLNDQAGQGLNINLVHGWAARDSNAMISIAKSTKDSLDSFSEEAALLRAGCVAMSLESKAFKTDPAKYRIIRRATTDTFNDTAARMYISNLVKHQKNYKFIITTLDLVGRYVKNKTPAILKADFPPSRIGSEWTIIPVRTGFQDADSLMVYIASFLDSRLWNGSVNWVSNINYKDDKKLTQEYRMCGMPAVNNLLVLGVTTFMLVLVDSQGQYSADTIILIVLMVGLTIITT